MRISKATRKSIRSVLLCATLALAPLVSFAAPGDGMFWSIEGPEGRAGYLLGTIHSEDPRVLEFPAEIIGALNDSSVFAMELVPDLPTLTRLLEVMHYQDGTSLKSVIGGERFDQLVSLLSGYGITVGQLAKMKPWAATLTLSVPPPESGLFMDFALSLRAAGNGLKVVSLETLDGQLSFLEDMPMDRQLDMLDQAIREFDAALDVYEQMMDRYLAGDLDGLLEHARAEMATLDPETREYFITEGLINRNHRMMEVMEEHLENGKFFATAGALHLPGEEGLVNLLRQSGWTLTPLPNPFAADGE